MDELLKLGWTPELESAFERYAGAGLVPGRVAVEEKAAYVVRLARGDVWARAPGRMLNARSRDTLPAVGDWVALELNDGWSTVQAVLPRSTAIVRKGAGHETVTQIVAANFDTVWILTALTAEMSARRVERFLAIAWDSGAQPVVVLTKADLDAARGERVAEVERITIGCRLHVTSAVTGEGLDELRGHLAGNRTAAVLGASGVGKSTLINALLGEDRIATQPTRADEVGRHTTTHRELVSMPDGGMLIDTPGLREVALWDAGGTQTLFEDVTALAARCRFADCRHSSEPGCAIKEAIASGELDAAHVKAYEKMLRELAFLARRRKYRPGIEWRHSHRKMSDRARERRLGIE